MRFFTLTFFTLCFLMQVSLVSAMSSFVDNMKGIGHGFESFGKTIGSGKFWKGMGRGFGAAPTGYVYSCTIVNDTSWGLNVTTREYASFMGATFPKAGGANNGLLQPYQQDYSIKKKQYYFDLIINFLSEKSSSDHGMPYTDPDALYVQSCITLPQEEHSTKMNYFHVYIGKGIQKGKFKHQPMVEYLGYKDPAHPKDKHASVKQVGSLTGSPALVVYNSTDQLVQIGYSSQQKQGTKSLKKSDCDLIFETIQENSFALQSGDKEVGDDKKKSVSYKYPLGTFGVFDVDATETSEIYMFPDTVFDGFTYTLEIYQDEGQSRQIGIQALQAAHDVPSNRVRDITPITCVFWHESVKQLAKSARKSMIDMPGNVWVIAPGDEGMMKIAVKAGDALKFTFSRPQIGNKSRLYFVYVDEQDAKKEKEFIDKFAAGKIGQNVLSKYETQSQNQFDKAKKALTTIMTFPLDAKESSKKAEVQVPEDLLIAAIQGALKVDGGEIKDDELGVSGFLLGSDVFLSDGLGSSDTFYYQLTPSQKSGDNIIKSIVQNNYTMGEKEAPDGMPTPTTYTKEQGATDLVSTELNQSAKSQQVVTGIESVQSVAKTVNASEKNIQTQKVNSGKSLTKKDFKKAKAL